MQEKFLFIANDLWFDFDKFLKDTNFEFYWSQKPKSVYTSSRVYLYLAGKTKAVKYELEIIEEKIDINFINVNYWSKYLINKNSSHFDHKKNEKICKLKMIREIQNLEKTNPKALKNDANILGSLMSNRKLKPFSISYLDSIK